MRAHDRSPLLRYRPWLLAAAAYNFVWGSITVALPGALWRVMGVPPPVPIGVWQVTGLFVLLFAAGYWWASRDPVKHRHIVLIGLAGKILGPIGFAFALLTGDLPPAFGFTIVVNDLIWLPAFSAFARDAAREAGGWRALLSGV